MFHAGLDANKLDGSNLSRITVFMGSHIFGTDKFPRLFQYFLSIFQYFYVYLMNLTHTKKLYKNKKWLKFPNFSSILDKIP